MFRIVFFLLFISFSVISFCNNSDTIVVSCKRIEFEIKQPYWQSPSYISSKGIPETDILYKDVKFPKNYPNLRLALFHFQPSQYFYYKYKQGELSKKNFNEYMQDYTLGLDTSCVCNNFIREYAIAGFEEKDGKVTAFIDINNDNDLSDETPYIYKIVDKDNMDSKDPKRYPVLKFTYNYFNGYKVSQRTVEAKLTFDPSNYYQSKESGGLSIFSPKHFIHEATITVNGNIFRIGLEDRIRQLSKKVARLGFAPNTRKLILPDISYMAGDTVVIGTQYFKFLTHSEDLDTVYLGKLQNDIKPIGPFEGLYAPEMTGVTLDGKAFSLKTLKGKYILIHIYSTWCVPCREANAPLKQLQKKYKNSNLVIINVTEEDNHDLVEKYAKKFGISWLNVYKKEKSPSNYNHIREFKTFMNRLGRCYLIAPDGKVLKVIHSFNIKESLIKECNEVLSKNI